MFSDFGQSYAFFRYRATCATKKVYLCTLLNHFCTRYKMKNIRIGHGYDVHQLAEGLSLTLGGVAIPHSKGCVAHSDGDAVIHALCDALLGAGAMGDIGLHFPDTSDEFKGIDSRILLRRTVALLREAGWEVGNVDCTIILQRPKVRPTSTKCARKWLRQWRLRSIRFRSKRPQPNASDSRVVRRALPPRP